VSGLVSIFVEIVVVIFVAAVLAWAASAMGAQGIVTTLIWVLAAVAILLLAIRGTDARRRGLDM
jgi:hypothetical protein